MTLKETIQNKFPLYAPAILRIGLALVFLWFGYQQLTENARWVGMVPDYVVAMSPLSASTLVTLNGLFEVAFGTLLLLGLFTRVVALLLALHMIQIVSSVGYSAIGVRDFGLCIATFAVFFFGSDLFSLDRKLSKKEAVREVSGI